MVDTAIGFYIDEMMKHTMKVYTLSVALTARDPASAYESIHDTLEKVFYFPQFNIRAASAIYSTSIGRNSFTF
jgi:hypothetical protein